MTHTSDLVGQLDLYLVAQGKSDRTVAEYSKFARRLARWCELHRHDLATLEPHQLRAWADQTVAPGRESRKNARSAVLHLYTMLGRHDEPWNAIRVPHKRKGKPRPHTPEEAGALRDAALMLGGRAGLATLGLMYTACRPGEVAQWRWDGIDLDERTIRFWRPKVSDWHEVPLHPVLADQLERFRGPYPEGFVFPGSAGRPFVGPATVWQWVKEVAALAGVEDCKPQRLRSTALSTALEATRDIDAVAELAGHQNPQVTRLYYTATSRRRLDAAVTGLTFDTDREEGSPRT